MLLHAMLQTSLSWPALIQTDNILIMTEASYSNAHLKNILNIVQSGLEAET